MLHFCNKSYDIQQGDYKERRVRGTLNAQAYFPWVDENRSRMMCYKVIDPTVALDNGIEAYCYYIREYLEVEVTDEKYQEYLLSLRIYVPSESLSELPLKEIKHRLSDVTFKRIKKSGEVSNLMSRKVSSICVCNFRLPRIRTIDYFTKNMR